jgi:hypothetical protein
MRVVAAAVTAAAADAVLVARHPQKLGAHLVTALASLRVRNLAKKQPGGKKHAEEKGIGGANKFGELRVVIWHGRHEMPVTREYPERENEVFLPLQPLEL